MRALLLLLFLMNVLFTLGSTAVLPDRVAVHFGWGGRADGWASLASSTAWSLAMDVFMLAVFLAGGWIARRAPQRYLSIPNKAYWCRDEHRGELDDKTTFHMSVFGTLMFAFLLGVKVLVLAANRAESARLNESAFFALLGAFGIATAAWLVWFYRAFRVPGGGGGRYRT
jgi:uncharacterized membrane protein